MNELIATAKAQQCLDLCRLSPAQPFRILTGVGRQPAGELMPCLVAHDERIAAFERALHSCHTGGQQALTIAQRSRGARIDVDFAGRLQGAGNPLLADGCR